MAILNFTGNVVGFNATFNVKNYETSAQLLADTPTNNTIGVVANSIGTIYFQNNNPSTGNTLDVNDIWIRSGSQSQTSMQYARRGSFIIYPVGISMWDGSAWAETYSMVYQNNTWRTMNFQVYTDGTENYTFVSGGGGTVTKTATYIDMHCPADNKHAMICTTSKIDMTSFSKLCMEYSIENGHSVTHTYVGITTNSSDVSDSDPTIVFETNQGTSDHRVEKFDISSAAGLYAVKARITASASYDYRVYIHKIWLEG